MPRATKRRYAQTFEGFARTRDRAGEAQARPAAVHSLFDRHREEENDMRTEEEFHRQRRAKTSLSKRFGFSISAMRVETLELL
jgi:hypothetical protein